VVIAAGKAHDTGARRPGHQPAMVLSDARGIVGPQCHYHGTQMEPMFVHQNNTDFTNLSVMLSFLDHAQLEFGGMVSTSNTYATEFVQVETDANLIWSMGAYEFEDKVRQAAKT